MTDDNSLNALQDWELAPQAESKSENQSDRETSRASQRVAPDEERKDRKKRLDPIFTWCPPYPCDARALFVCLNSEHRTHANDDWDDFYWIAVRLTEDKKAFELVRMGQWNDKIIEAYPGRYDCLYDAEYAAISLSITWDQQWTDILASGMRDERDLTRNLKLNPWGRAVWERKHEEGPVLVVWQMEPLSLFVAGWLPFAGSRCVPTPVLFAYESDPSRINTVVDNLAEDAFLAGPSPKMISRAKSIAASYAANGRKGGRPKKGRKPPKDCGEEE